MKLLLDESLPRRLKAAFRDHEVYTVPEQGWAGLSNGALLTRAAERFDVFITADQNLPYQQNLSSFEIAILVLAARSNTLADLEELIPRALAALDKLTPGSAEVVAG